MHYDNNHTVTVRIGRLSEEELQRVLVDHQFRAQHRHRCIRERRCTRIRLTTGFLAVFFFGTYLLARLLGASHEEIAIVLYGAMLAPTLMMLGLYISALVRDRRRL